MTTPQPRHATEPVRARSETTTDLPENLFNPSPALPWNRPVLVPLGAGGHSVRLNGIVYEGGSRAAQATGPCDLYHSALEICVRDGRFVIEMTPVRAADGAQRDVVAVGPVGVRRAGRLRIFRYEIPRWRDGFIPDVAEAVESPRHVVSDAEGAQQRLDLVPSVPTLFGVAMS